MTAATVTQEPPASRLDVLGAVRRRWVTCLLVTVAFAAGVAATVQRLPDTYASRAVVAFGPYAGGADRLDPAMLRLLVAKYAEYAGSAAVLEEAAERSGQPLVALDEGISIQTPPETGNLEIVAELGAPRAARRAADEVAAAVNAFAAADAAVDADVVVPATRPQRPSGPSRVLMMLSGLAGAMALGVAAAVAIDWRWRRLQRPQDIELQVGAPVIGFFAPPPAALLTPKTIKDARVGRDARMLRDNLHLLEDSTGTTLLVTSLGQACRSSRAAVSLLLAESVAVVSGCSALVVQGDRHDDRILSALGMPAVSEGWYSTVVARGGTSANGVGPVEATPGLWLLQSGISSNGHFLDLQPDRLRGYFSRTGKPFRVVVLDGPPMEDRAAVTAMVASADRVLVVIEPSPRLVDVRLARETLTNLGVRDVAFVICRQPRTSRGLRRPRAAASA